MLWVVMEHRWVIPLLCVPHQDQREQVLLSAIPRLELHCLFRVEGVDLDMVFGALLKRTMQYPEPGELLILVGEVLVIK
jgi:hypothetical protein